MDSRVISVEFSRENWVDVKQRAGVNHPGIYVLWEEPNPSVRPTVYVGKGNSKTSTPRSRVNRHMKEMSFWTHGVIFTSQAQTFQSVVGKIDLPKWVEHHLWLSAYMLDRCDQYGYSHKPSPPSLSPSHLKLAEDFLGEVRRWFNNRNLYWFCPQHDPGLLPRDWERNQSWLRLHNHKRGAEALGFQHRQPDWFIVKENSVASLQIDEVKDNLAPRWLVIRKALIDYGRLQDGEGGYRLTTDWHFSSSSEAASVFLGGSRNGKRHWL